MSVHTYGMHGYGMFLDMNEMDSFSWTYAKVKKIREDTLDWFEDFGARDLTNDELFDGREIRHLDGRPHAEDDDDFCEGVFFYADRQGDIFAAPAKNYLNVREMADEFRQKYAAYLPEDFDYEAHMVEFTGTFSC